jgi:hypothetical protein
MLGNYLKLRITVPWLVPEGALALVVEGAGVAQGQRQGVRSCMQSDGVRTARDTAVDTGAADRAPGGGAVAPVWAPPRCSHLADARAGKNPRRGDLAWARRYLRPYRHRVALLCASAVEC